MTKEEFNRLLNEMPNYEIISSKITSDVRPGREEEKWLNIFLKRK